MSSRLENFIRDHRDEFDGDEPGAHVWKHVEERLNRSEVGTRLSRVAMFRWTAVAAMTILVTLSVFYFMGSKGKDDVTALNGQTNDIINAINPEYAKEVYHFTQLIELKQTELKKIGKDQPGLYREFIGEITTLDSSYNALKKELPQNPNREQLLEAMIENLRLQTELLNQQLLIIKKIKQAKTTSDESNSKSI